MDPQDRRDIACGEDTWSVTRDTGVRTSASSEGYYPKPGRRGFLFVSAKGEDRFLAVGLTDLPDRDEFQSMSAERLCELLAKAKPLA